MATVLVEHEELKPIVPERREVQLGDTTAKLSEMWWWASKNLKQVKGKFGDAFNKEACAIGAIHYFLSGGHYTNFAPDSELKDRMEEAMRKFRHVNEPGAFKDATREVARMNDNDDWTFEMFAEEAERMGL